MAYRRRIGASLSNFGDILREYIRAQLQQDSQTRQHQLNTERDLLTNRLLTQRQAQLQRMIDDRQREAARMEREQEVADAGGPAGPLFSEIDKATDPSALPTLPSLTSRAKARGIKQEMEVLPSPAGFPIPFQTGDIGQLLAARSEKEKALMEQARRQFDASNVIYNPEIGAKGKTDPTGQFVQTEPTGQQAGEQDAAQALAGRLSKPVIAAEGSLSGSRAAGATAGTINTEFGLIDKVRAIAEAKRDPRQGGGAAAANAAAIPPLALKMVDLANAINAEQPQHVDDTLSALGRLARTGKQYVLGKAQVMGTGENVKELTDMREGFVPMLARMIGHVGVLTQQDVDSVKRILPDYGLTGESNTRRNRNFLNFAAAAARMGQELGPTGGDPAEASRRIQLLLQQYGEGAAAEVMSPEELQQFLQQRRGGR